MGSAPQNEDQRGDTHGPSGDAVGARSAPGPPRFATKHPGLKKNLQGKKMVDPKKSGGTNFGDGEKSCAAHL